MKKLTKIVLLVVVLVLSLVLATACETLKNHEHKFSTAWSTDGTNHYHACTFEGCTEKSNVTACAGGKATCQAKATCLVCGNEYGELGQHKFNLGYATEEFLATPATHTEKATYYKSCVCGLKGSETFQAGEVVAHDFQEVVNEELKVSDATCTQPATYKLSCECGAISDETFAHGQALGHTEVIDAAVEATCTTDGITAGKHCSVCEAVIVAQEVVPATGHKFIDGKCVCGLEYAPQLPWLLTTELKDGDHVLIGAPHYGKLLSAEKVSATSYYNKGVNYSATDFANVTNAEIFVVKVNDDGTYTFTSLTGKVIALASSYSSLNETGEHKSWALTSKGDGTFLVKNTGRNTYLEWYSSKGNWSTYTAGNTKEYYLSFYVKNADYSEEHVHNHISAVTAPTCTEAGYTTYTCECEDTYTEAGADATGHTFVRGICACGEQDPNYVDYYLIGYINGADYGNAGDWENLGEYKFVDGTLVVTFTADSYVGIKSANLKGEIVGWFWSKNYETSNVGTFEHGKNYGEKMFISGNVRTTFTLVVNEDGSLTLSVEYHKHSYETNVTPATCTTAGYTTHTCACGDSYTDTPVEQLGHIDENLDVECDREGCTSKIAPKADSTLSLATANALGAKLSTSNQYYVVGKIVRYYTEGDSKNGIFYIADENGVEFLIRMPKNEAGSTHSAWTFRLVIGDTVKFYGKINKFTASSGSIPAMQSGLFVEYISKHTCDFTNVPATCFEPAYCDCLASHGSPADHVDANTDGACDICGLNSNLKLSKISTAFNNIKETDAYDATAGTATFVGADFTAVFAKGTASLSTNGTDNMRLQKGNTLTISANNGKKISAITFTASSASYVDEMEAILTAAGFTYEVKGLHITIAVDNLDTFTLTNSASKIGRIASIYVGYADAQ